MTSNTVATPPATAAAQQGRNPAHAHTQPPIERAASGDAGRGGRGSGGADCLGCRITGGLFGIGGGGFIASRLLEEPPPRGAHRAALVAMAGAVFCMGMYRAFAD